MDNNYENIITVKFARAEQPEFRENKSKDIVEFGKNNDYPNFLLDLYNESPKHGAIIKGKVNYIYGKGFADNNEVANLNGETWNDLLKKCIVDDEIYAGYYLQFVWNKAGQVKCVYHLPFHTVRVSPCGGMFHVKKDWKDNKEKARCYSKFTGIFTAKEDDYSQVLFVKQYNPKGDAYPVPNYFQGLNYVDADVQVSRHILGNAKDGFVATTLIEMNNGAPQEEQKAAVEKGLKKKFTGSEGDRVVIMFNSSKETGASITPLSNTMLTKEDFTNINNLIQQEIFAAHQVTSPMLFGIKTEGQLGGRSEIQDAYEIFKNTYVSERQQAHQDNFNKIFKLISKPEQKIVPVEPLGFTIKDDMLLKVMPREYFMDKIGVDQKYYALPPAEGGTTTAPAGPAVPTANSVLTNMTGRQFQHLDRIKKRYKANNLSRQEAALMLKNSFGFTDDDVSVFLDQNSDDQQFALQDEIDFALIEQFSQVGDDANQFEVLSKKPAREAEFFADVKQLSELESNVLNLIKKDKRATPEVIAEVLKTDAKLVTEIIKRLTDNNIITQKIEKVGEDQIIERTATDQRPPGYKPTTTDILLRYSYEGPQDERNRPFCAKLMELNRLYSRADIERISERLGYSVWDRRGGWFTQPDGTHRPYCRHSWFAVTVIKKS